MGDECAFAEIGAKSRVDQELSRRCDLLATHGPGDRGGEIAAGAVAAQDDRKLVGVRDMTERGQRILELGGMQVLGGESVIHGYDDMAGASADFRADAVMAVEPAEDEPAAVQIKHHRLRSAGGLRVFTHRDRRCRARKRNVPDRHALRAAGVESLAQAVVDAALPGEVETGRVRRVMGDRFVDEGPGFLVDQSVIGSGTQWRFLSRVKHPC